MEQHINLKITDIEDGTIQIEGNFVPEIKKGQEITKAQQASIDIYNYIMERCKE